MTQEPLPEFTHPTARGLHASILADPDDDTPRLVFADWLDERGSAAAGERAEFIRLQIRLAGIASQREEPERRLEKVRWRRHPIAGRSEGWDEWAASGKKAEYDRLRTRLAGIDAQGREPERRTKELLGRHRGTWLSPVTAIGSRRPRFSRETAESAVAIDWVFRRGFVATWRTTAAHFLEQATAVFERVPLTELDLVYTRLTDEDVRRLAALPLLSRLRRLHLGWNGIRSPAAIALAQSPYVVNLTTLRLGGTLVEWDGAQALADSPYLLRLRELSLESTRVDAKYDCTQRLRQRFGEGVKAYRASN